MTLMPPDRPAHGAMAIELNPDTGTATLIPSQFANGTLTPFTLARRSFQIDDPTAAELRTRILVTAYAHTITVPDIARRWNLAPSTADALAVDLADAGLIEPIDHGNPATTPLRLTWEGLTYAEPLLAARRALAAAEDDERRDALEAARIDALIGLYADT